MKWIDGLFVLLVWLHSARALEFNDQKIHEYRERVRSMFYFAYDSYLEHAFPYDELKPITCTGMDTWGSFSLTLVDALDTLIILGNYTEFERAAQLVLQNVDADANVNVSVFETNIRVIGGLISAHMLSGLNRTSHLVEDGWPCTGPLLRLAERFADKLLVAFNSETGMPYGTVNLRYGVHREETPITCTAGVGTFLIEMGTLSRLTGNPHYERVALRAMHQLWRRRSPIGLVGNHINVQSGQWTATDSGIGAGVDSYFEYLAKAAILLQRPELMRQFHSYVQAINTHVRHDDWFLWVSMAKGQVSLPIFQSLEAFWPGVLTLVGQVDDAQRIMLTYNQIIRQYGFVPEFYNIPNTDAVHKRSGYPLRPEMAESLMYLYRATHDPQWLQIGADMIEAIDYSCRTNCGYATVHSVKDHVIEDRMESFFLAETTKYLYLLFDPDNFIHNDGTEARVVDTPSGKCAVFGGGYTFNTEAHPVDPAQLYCCSGERAHDMHIIEQFANNIDFTELFGFNDILNNDEVKQEDEQQKMDVPTGVKELFETQKLQQKEIEDVLARRSEKEGAAEDGSNFSIEYQTQNGQTGSVNATNQTLVQVSPTAGKASLPAEQSRSAGAMAVEAAASVRRPSTAVSDQIATQKALTVAVEAALRRIGYSYEQLIDAHEQLERWAAAQPCPQCCLAESRTRRWLGAMQAAVRRPARRCLWSEAPPREQDLYNNTMPPPLGDHVDESLKAARRRTLQKICVHPNEIELGTYVEWQSSLMSCPARPFLSRFTGVGQVMQMTIA